MVEESKRRLEYSLRKLVEEIENAYLRNMQRDMHRCAATCCDNDTYSKEEVLNCVENCQKPLKKAQEYMHGEIVRNQDPFHRCVMDCGSRIRDKMGRYPSGNKITIYKKELDECQTKCTDDYCKQLPSLKQTIKEMLSNRKYEKP